MQRLYALQQRLAITSTESSGLLFIALLLLVGSGVRYWQGQSVPYSAEHYAELDADFAVRAAALRAEHAAPESEGAGEAEGAPVVAEERRTSRRTAKAGPVRMNLNTASEGLLQRLPGIGPKMAERITEYRAAHGDFLRAEDLVRVKGIGPKTYEKLAPYLFVEDGLPVEAAATEGS